MENSLLNSIGPIDSDSADMLLGQLGEAAFFSDHTNDEFTVKREDGRIQGIFKVWASPIIPLLEFDDASPENANKLWYENYKSKPFALYQSLERHRGVSAENDRRLQLIFDREAPKVKSLSIPEKMAHLLMRQTVSCALTSPFYNLEALVADSRDIKLYNPIDFEEKESSGGELDAVVMCLPAALKTILTSKRLDWGELNWELINKKIEDLRISFNSDQSSRDAKMFEMIIKVSSLANVSPEKVLFAANALEFIPVDVGGKKDDLTQEEALYLIDKALNAGHSVPSTLGVSKHLNSLIRFLNWLPAVVDDRNFEGHFWTYDSVCKTAQETVALAVENSDKIFKNEFRTIFIEKLAHQLSELDANSAKGRFMLSLLKEFVYIDDINQIYRGNVIDYYKQIVGQLSELKKEESVLELFTDMSPVFIGGKSIGINQAKNLLGAENVLSGKIVSGEFLHSLLEENSAIKSNIKYLHRSRSEIEKNNACANICKEIEENLRIPKDILETLALYFKDKNVVIRSSSFDEDNGIFGSSPGIYESVVNIGSSVHELEQGIKEVMKSFFSEKAVSFRELKQINHTPYMSVIIQEFIDNVGGTVFIDENGLKINIAKNAHAINLKDHYFEEYTESINDESVLADKKTIEGISTLARKIFDVFGPSDLEFVINPDTHQPLLLQKRQLLHLGTSHSDKVINTKPIAKLELNILEDLPEKLPANRKHILSLSSAIDLDRFQGKFFRWLVRNNDALEGIEIKTSIANNSHFYNILSTLGIKIYSSI